MSEFSKLGIFLRKQRIANDFSQTELARALKMHSQFVSNWERGLCAPPSEKLPALIELLKIDRNKLADAMLMDAKLEIREKVYRKTKKDAFNESSAQQSSTAVKRPSNLPTCETFRR